MTEHQRRALVRVLRDEVTHSADRERLLLHARHWLYEHRHSSCTTASSAAWWRLH